MFYRRLLRGISIVALLALSTVLLECGGSSSSPAPPAPAPPAAPPPPSGPLVLTLTPVLSGLNSPVDLQNAADGSGRLFVVEQQGQIRIVSNNSLVPTPFLDITSLVDFGGEKG